MMTEKEYIEREPIIQFIEHGLNEKKFGYDAIEILGEIQFTPAADVAPVTHGHWIFKKRTKLVSTGIVKVAEDRTAVIMKKHITVKVPYCSICGERGGDDKLDATLFCPNCGAKMDDKNNNNDNDNNDD